MSFIFPPAGLERLPGANDGSGSAASFVRILGLEGRGSQSCPDYHGAMMLCPGPGLGVGSFAVALADIPFNTSADYFAVRAWVEGPALDGADCIEAFAPTIGPCGFNGAASYDGIVEPTPWVRALGSGDPVGYAAQSNEYTASNADGEGGFNAQVDWPHDAVLGIVYLVNPAPTWPVPDAHGNEFGMCLFTLGQLPAEVSTAITYSSYDQPIGGRLWVAVTAFTEDEPGEPVRTRRGTIIGHA